MLYFLYHNDQTLANICYRFHTKFDSANLYIISACNATGTKGIVYTWWDEFSFLRDLFNHHLALMITIYIPSMKIINKTNSNHTNHTQCTHLVWMKAFVWLWHKHQWNKLTLKCLKDELKINSKKVYNKENLSMHVLIKPKSTATLTAQNSNRNASQQKHTYEE